MNAPARMLPPPAVLPEQVREQLAAARQKMQELTQRQVELAEMSVTDSDAERAYHEVCAEMTRVDSKVIRLEAAVAGMERRAEIARPRPSCASRPSYGRGS